VFGRRHLQAGFGNRYGHGLNFPVLAGIISRGVGGISGVVEVRLVQRKAAVQTMVQYYSIRLFKV
jgi:hypothetical protein